MPEITDDGLTWTFELKRGIHYGPPMQDVEITAPDLIRALERAATPSVARGDFLPDLSVIEGFADFAEGRATSISGLEAPDTYLLEVHLNEPTNDLGFRLALPAAAPIPPSPTDPSVRFGVAQGHDSGYGRYLVASGPYMILGSPQLDFSAPPAEQAPVAGLIPGKSLTLVRNPSWTAETDVLRKAYVDRIEMTAVTLDDGVQAIDQGTLDVLIDAASPPDQVRRYESDPELATRVFRQSCNNVGYAAMNLASSPFDDVHVRRAVNLAFDADRASELLSSIPFGPFGYIPSTSIGHIAPDSTENDLLRDWDPYPFDAERARQEMARSMYDDDGDGYCDDPSCRGIPALDTNFGPEPLYERVWREGLREVGITLDIRHLSFGRALRESADPSNHVAFNLVPFWDAEYPDAGTLFVSQLGSQALGATGLSNFSLVGATPDQLRGWGYDVRVVPNIDQAIDGCLSRIGFERRLCWAELDQLLMVKIVPWATWFVVWEIRVVSSRVIRFSFDQAVGTLPALDQIAIATSPESSDQAFTDTQTDPPPTATSSTPAPMAMDWTSLESGSIRESVPSRLLATQIASSPTATPIGPWPTETVVARSVSGSMNETISASKPVTHAVPASSAAICVGGARSPGDATM
jgi:ABC-type transport system substrate-binding protein